MTKSKTDTNTSQMNRTRARLAAVQALYQIHLSNKTPAKVVVDETIANGFDQALDTVSIGDVDQEHFSTLVLGVVDRLEEIDALINGALKEGWKTDRLESILLMILRTAIFETLACVDVPSKVILNEYLNITHAFYDGPEKSLVNGILDTLVKQIRT